MAVMFTFTGNTYPYRAMFKEAGGRFFYNPRRWVVPANRRGECPNPALLRLEGVVWSSGDDGTTRRPQQPPQNRVQRPIPVREVSSEVEEENSLESELESRNGYVGENDQEPIDPNACPF
jgi:hypothetical protein